MAVAFDTYTAAKRLRDAGFDEAQAEAAVVMVREAVTEGFATARAEATRQASAETAALQAGFVRLESAVEGHVARLDARMEGLDARMEGLDARMEGLEGRIEGLDARMEGLEGRVGGLETRVGNLDIKVEGLAARVENCATRGDLYKALWAQGCALIVAITALGGLAAVVVGLLL